MEPEISFEQFFATKIKERGISLKKLADVTGIAPMHIESLLRGDFDAMPSAPYFRGYLLRLGEELGFDGEEWWRRIRKDGLTKNSGAADVLPRNRFMKEAPPKYLWAIAVAALIVIYFAFQAPRILGKPTLTVNFPSSNPYATSSSTITISGTVVNADAVYLNGTQEIAVNPDGSWQQTVLLGAGPNPFEISAKKFLGGETSLTETILYEPVGGVPADTSVPGTTTTATSTGTAASSSGTPANSSTARILP